MGSYEKVTTITQVLLEKSKKMLNSAVELAKPKPHMLPVYERLVRLIQGYAKLIDGLVIVVTFGCYETGIEARIASLWIHYAWKRQFRKP